VAPLVILDGLLPAGRRDGRAVHAVLLHPAGGDFRDAELAEKRDEVQAQTDVVARDPALAALALGDDAVFLGELVSSLLEGFLGRQEASAGFAAQLKDISPPQGFWRGRDSPPSYWRRCLPPSEAAHHQEPLSPRR
jgi:hypothetical protein